MVFAYLNIVGRSNTGMNALIEILNLCADALTSLGSAQEARAEKDAQKARSVSAASHRKAAPRLTLIPGGLSRCDRRESSR